MSGPDSSILAQLDIRNNVREMQDSMSDLHSWERDMAAKEKKLLKQKSAGANKPAPAIRGRAPPVQAASDPSLHTPHASLMPGAAADLMGLCCRYAGTHLPAMMVQTPLEITMIMHDNSR